VDISRSCKVPNLNWALVPAFAARLEKQGWSLAETSVEVQSPPDTLEFDSIEEACENVRAQGSPSLCVYR
jgi:lambda repressor-like predicted transcriptional regulator